MITFILLGMFLMLGLVYGYKLIKKNGFDFEIGGNLRLRLGRNKSSSDSSDTRRQSLLPPEARQLPPREGEHDTAISSRD